VYLPPEDPAMAFILEFIKQPRTRAVTPVQKISLEHINGTEAASSPYNEIFKSGGFIPDRGKLLLW
jgi:hypothetical protein